MLLQRELHFLNSVQEHQVHGLSQCGLERVAELSQVLQRDAEKSQASQQGAAALMPDSQPSHKVHHGVHAHEYQVGSVSIDVPCTTHGGDTAAGGAKTATDTATVGASTSKGGNAGEDGKGSTGGDENEDGEDWQGSKQALQSSQSSPSQAFTGSCRSVTPSQESSENKSVLNGSQTSRESSENKSVLNDSQTSVADKSVLTSSQTSLANKSVLTSPQTSSANKSVLNESQDTEEEMKIMSQTIGSESERLDTFASRFGEMFTEASERMRRSFAQFRKVWLSRDKVSHSFDERVQSWNETEHACLSIFNLQMCVYVCLGIFIILLESSEMCVRTCLGFATMVVRMPAQLLSGISEAQLWRLGMCTSCDFNYVHQQVALSDMSIFLGSVCALCAILKVRKSQAGVYVVLSSWYSSVANNKENGALPTTAWKKAQQENSGDRMEKIKEQPENNEHDALG